MRADSNFPVLHGKRIKNTNDLRAALGAAMAGTIAGKITVKDANAINRDAREILKVFQAVVRCAKLSRTSSNLVR